MFTTDPKLLLMVDIESLDLGPRCVITQIAMLGYDLEQDKHLSIRYAESLPVQPQIDMASPRTVSMSTLWFWMQQPDEARRRFEDSLGDDPFDLQYLGKSFIDTFRRMVAGYESYVICAKGPQFDLVAIESLLTDLDLSAPWDYDAVDDLRTMLRHSKIDPYEVPKPEGFIKHVAYWDARFQINQYLACRAGTVKILTEEHKDPTGLPSLDPQKPLPGLPRT
jgi:hypothetical protein